MKVDRSFVTNEDQGKIDWAPNGAASYAVVNKDKPNQWGEYPGFKVYPLTGSSIHLTIENSSDIGELANLATNPLYVLKRKDSEPSAVYRYNELNYQHPLVNFNDFFDGESLDQEDLVLYFNLGMHHLPDQSDLPATVFTNAASGLTIRPVNYLLYDPSRDTRQQVRIRRGSAQPKVNYYGASLSSGSFDLDSANPDLSTILSRGN